MLEVTSNAAATLADARSRGGVPDHFGVRIYAAKEGDTEGPAFQLGFASDPQEGDQVGETEATRYFVAPDVAGPLENAVLDAEDTEEGPKLVLKRRV